MRRGTWPDIVAVCGFVAAVTLGVQPFAAMGDPVEIGSETVPVQVSSSLKVEFGRSDAPLFGLHAGGGDSHLNSNDGFRYLQLGVTSEAQYRDLSAKVELLLTNAHESWVDYFSRRDYWIREASIRWKTPYGSVTAGHLNYDFGFGVEANGSLIPLNGIRFDTQFKGFDFTYLTARVPANANTTPQFVQLFGGYAAPNAQDVVGVYRVSRELRSPTAATTIGLTVVRPSIGLGRRYSLDMRSVLNDGREIRAVYQTTPRNVYGVDRPDDQLFALTGDVVKKGRWHVRAGWAETGANYAMALNSNLFPYATSYDELVFDRPLFLGAPIPTDNPNAPSATVPDYGFLMDGMELDARYRLTESSELQARYIRGDQANGVSLGEIWKFAYRKNIGHTMTAEFSYGHVSADDPFNVGAPSYDTVRLGLVIGGVAGLVEDYASEH